MASEMRRYHRRRRGPGLLKRGTPHRRSDIFLGEELEGHDGDDESSPVPKTRLREFGRLSSLKRGQKRPSTSSTPEPRRKRSRTRKAREALLKSYMPKEKAEFYRRYFGEVDQEVLEETSASDNSESWQLGTGSETSQERAVSPSPWQHVAPLKSGLDEQPPGSVPRTGSAGRDHPQRTASGPSRMSTGSTGRRSTDALQSAGCSEEASVGRPSPSLSRRRQSPRDNSGPGMGVPAADAYEEPGFPRPQSARKPMQLMETLHEEEGGERQQTRSRKSDLFRWENVGLGPVNTPGHGGSGAGGEQDAWEWGELAERMQQGQAGKHQPSQSVRGRQDTQSPGDRSRVIAARLKQGYCAVPELPGRRALDILEPVEEVSERTQTASQTQPTRAGSKDVKAVNSGVLSPSSSVAWPKAATSGKGVGPDGAAGASGLSAHGAPMSQPPSADSGQAMPMPREASQLGTSGVAEAARNADSRLLASSGAQRDCLGLQAGVDKTSDKTVGPSQNGAAPPAVNRKSSVGIACGAACADHEPIQGPDARVSGGEAQVESGDSSGQVSSAHRSAGSADASIGDEALSEPAAAGAQVDPPVAEPQTGGLPIMQSMGMGATDHIQPEQEAQAQDAGSPGHVPGDASAMPRQSLGEETVLMEQGKEPAASGVPEPVEPHAARTPQAIRPVKQSIGMAAPVAIQSERESQAPGRRPSLPGSSLARSAQVLASIARHFSRPSGGPGAIFPGTPLSRSDRVKGSLGGGIPFNLPNGAKQALARGLTAGPGISNQSRRSLAGPRYVDGRDTTGGPLQRMLMWRRMSLSGDILWRAEQEQAQSHQLAQGGEQEGHVQDFAGAGTENTESDASDDALERACSGVPPLGASSGDEGALPDAEKENQGRNSLQPAIVEVGQQGRKSSIGILLHDAAARLNQEGATAEVGEKGPPICAAGAPLPKGTALQSEDDVATAALQRMLEMGHQDAPCGLEDALSEFCNVEDITKLGEGSYAEAFGVLSEAPHPRARAAPCNSVCFKIVPMGGPAIEGEEQKPIAELETEVAIHVALNRLREGGARDGHDSPAARTMGFIELKGVRVCKGPYPKVLLDAWTAWDEQFESENLDPSCYTQAQLYCVFALEMGGTNLEEYHIRSFDEARAILFQITAALSAAQEGCQFEHRDLHWGNVMISQTAQSSDSVTLGGVSHAFKTWGLKVSIIDFTLSRVHTGERVIFCDLSKDKQLFEGPQGDIQFDTYRAMKKLSRRKWNGWHPKSNVLWLSYLLEMVCKRKMLVLSPSEDRLVAAFKKTVVRADTLQGLIHDKFFEGIITQEPGA